MSGLEPQAAAGTSGLTLPPWAVLIALAAIGLVILIIILRRSGR
jgi:hypothetical protein